jgi:ribosome-associated protein
VARKGKSARWSSKELAIKIARLADEKQAAKIVILDVAQAIQVADYFVLCDGLNRRHLGVIGEHVARELKKDGVYRMGGNPAPDESWVLLDFGPVVLHVFSPKARAYYDLENLWGDCKRLRWRRVAPKAQGAVEMPRFEGDVEGFAPRADVADDEDAAPPA